MSPPYFQALESSMDVQCIVDSLERQAKGDYPILVKLPYRFSESEPVLPKIE